MTKIKYTVIILSIVLLLIIWLSLPFREKAIVLSVKIRNSNSEIELWEKPQLNPFIFQTEYQTWFVFKENNEIPRWYMIDRQYITFRRVSVFISSNMNQIRVETNGDSEETHLIAEYNIKEKLFSARSEQTVRNKSGWNLLIEKKIRDF